MESDKSFSALPTPLSQQGAQISGINFTSSGLSSISVTSKGLFDEGTRLLG